MTTQNAQVFDLPPPRANSPILTRMISDALADTPAEGGKPIAWILGEPHPFSGWRIVRMFIDSEGGGVEVYAVSPNSKHATRSLVPMPRVRLIEEGMSLEVLIEELDVAESDDDDDDPELPEPEASVDTAPNAVT